MIIITLFQVIYTRCLLAHRKEDNGLLAMVVITLLVIVWLIIIRKPSLWQEPHVLWSKL
jgi:type II secretory pathway component PulM